jgi:hypothetical protein
VRSWGRVRKRHGAGRPLGGRAGDGNGASNIRVLLSKDNTGYSGVSMNKRKHRAEEKACQYNILGAAREEKRWI